MVLISSPDYERAMKLLADARRIQDTQVIGLCEDNNSAVEVYEKLEQIEQLLFPATDER